MLFRRSRILAILLLVVSIVIPQLPSRADTATDTATLNACVQTFLQVEINEAGWSDVINPVQFNPITFPITGFVKTNAVGPNTLSSPVIVSIQSSSGSQVKLRRFPMDQYGIKVFFTGTVGSSPNNNVTDQPMTPQFNSGEAIIDLNGTIDINSPRNQANNIIPWGELPPGVYNGALTITATLSQ
jgi:hypothetical protein